MQEEQCTIRWVDPFSVIKGCRAFPGDGAGVGAALISPTKVVRLAVHIVWKRTVSGYLPGLPVGERAREFVVINAFFGPASAEGP